ncbi:hypothetical protein [Intrasporangium sp.]|uniref:hypothetical protein n=1 Tax=Intrasporangium sp. TaxID=1925024 RepID=UPI002939DA53|nr:hypothetical protein [Intrasporangium sp.]MDV3222713.1 hypothetical protein [Intrasporangium sp.]
MPAPRRPPTPDIAALRPLQLVSAAIGIGALMVTAMRVLVDPEPVPPSWLAVGIVLASIVGATALIMLFGYSVPSLPQGLPRENAARTSLRYFGSTTILRSAIAETPVLVAFAVSFLVTPHSWLPLLMALPVTVALFWWHAWPSPRTAAAVERGLEAEGAESHLSETLGFRAG